MQVVPLVEALRLSLFSTWMVRSWEEGEDLLILAVSNSSWPRAEVPLAAFASPSRPSDSKASDSSDFCAGNPHGSRELAAVVLDGQAKVPPYGG
jgi:hypothetical protein